MSPESTAVARCDDLGLERFEARLQREPVCQSVVHVSFKCRRSFWRDKEEGRDQQRIYRGHAKNTFVAHRLSLTQLMSLGLGWPDGEGRRRARGSAFNGRFQIRSPARDSRNRISEIRGVPLRPLLTLPGLLPFREGPRLVTWPC